MAAPQAMAPALRAYWLRALGGTLYLVGALMMVYNVWRTVAQGKLSGQQIDLHWATGKPIAVLRVELDAELSASARLRATAGTALVATV